MLKRLLLATTAAAGLAMPVHAADLPGTLVKAPAALLGWNWSGFYIGANVGGARAEGTLTDTVVGLGSIATAEALTGLAGGAQIGVGPV